MVDKSLIGAGIGLLLGAGYGYLLFLGLPTEDWLYEQELRRQNMLKYGTIGALAGGLIGYIIK